MLKIIAIILAVTVLSWVPSLIRAEVTRVKIWWEGKHVADRYKWMYK